MMSSKYKTADKKCSNESLHSLLDHESIDGPEDLSFELAEHDKMWLSTKEASASSAEDVVARLRVSYRSGLSWKESEFRRQMTGYNEFSVHQGDPLWKKYVEQD